MLDPFVRTVDQEFTGNELRMLKYLCETDHLYFMRYIFRKRWGFKVMLPQYLPILCDTMDRVITGEIARLVINIPPGYTKTESAVIALVSRGLAINPAAKFIHTSYADSLVLLNSTTIRDTLSLPEYQMLWPRQLKADTKAKGLWYTKEGGGLLAASAGGPITGFRAGQVGEGFTGAFIIDDPIKPDDAFSDVKRTFINNRFNNTFKSRLMHPGIPMIVIQQRLHEEDSTNFLLTGGTGDKWHHLNLPVRIPNEPEPYPEQYTHGIPIPYDLPPGPLWTYKHTDEDIDTLLATDPYTTAAQYMQRPTPLGGGIFKDHWWQYYDKVPDLKLKAIYADTASKTAEHNDYSVFVCVGIGYDGNLYILDVLRGKWEAPELLQQAELFWAKHRKVNFRPLASTFKVEDKSSGIGLIQQLSRNIHFNIQGIPRDTDKVRRAMAAIPEFAKGRVYLPSGPTELTDAGWVLDFKQEFSKFSPAMTHRYDDQIDPTLDAVDDLLINSYLNLYDNL